MAEKLRVAFIDNSQAIDDQAIDAGEAKMTADKESLKGFSGFLKKIWKHNLARNYYRQKEINTARQQILESGNLFAAAEGSQDEFIAEQEAIVDRFMADHAEMIHQEAGESRRVIGETPEDKIFSDSLRNLIDKFVAGEINETELEEEKVRLLNSLPDFDDKNGRLKVGCADNLLAIAKQAKQSLNHQSGLAKLDYDLEIIVGRAVSGVRTEAKYNKVDRILEKLGKTKIGALINESTLGLAVAAATATAVSLGQTAGQMAARALGGLGLGALLTGGLAAMRESQELKRERKQHSREMAQGKRFKKDDVRRQEMEKFNYKTIKSVDILSGLEINFNEADTDNQAEIKQVVTNLADLEARIRLSDQQKIDLIAFSNLTNVEQERLELDLARARLKVTLRRLADHDKLNFVDGNLDDYLNSLIEAKKQELLGGDNGITEKDRLFNKMRKARMVSTGINAAGIGFAVGLAFQEAASFFRSDQQGLIEGAIKGRQPTSGHQSVTLLEKARAMIFGQPKLQQAQELVRIGDHQFKVPVGTEIRPEADGEFSIFSGGKKLIGDLRLTNGQLSAESQADLAKHGINWLTQENRVAGSLGAQEVIEQNKKNFTNIVRRLWYDNDTKSFDKNELRVFWGGKYGSGLDQDGNILLNMQKMAPDGSYHTLAGQKLSADAQQLIKNGGLKLLLSLSKGTQNQVIEIPINSDGLAVIPKGSLAASLFSHANGVTKFTGQFMEVAQTMGSVENGAEAVRILATQVGQGIPDGSTIINEIVHSIDIPAVTTWEVPPIIPIMGRRPLEPAEKKNVAERLSYYYGYGGESYGLLDRNKYRERMSKKILENPNINLSEDDSEIVDEYLAKQNKEHQKDLFEMIKEVPPMDSATEVVITVPAYMEGGVLEKTLRNYAKLNNKEKFEICILENHPKDKERDNTKDVIQKIQAEFPDLKIIHLYKVFDKKPAIGLVRKCLVDAVLLRKQQAGITKPVTIVSNDADLEDISPDYVNHVSESFLKNSELDAIGAKWDFPRETFKQMPLLHASQRLWQYLDIALRYYYLHSPELIGRNSAFNSGIYAAIGGYNETSQLAEDLEIGWLIKEARNYNSDRIDYNNKAWLISNPRRAVVKMLSDNRLIQQYGDFHVNEEVRNAPLDKLLENKIDFDEPSFIKEVQAIYDHYSRMTISRGGFMEDQFLERAFARAMRFMNLEFEINNNNISIKNIETLKKSLEDYYNS